MNSPPLVVAVESTIDIGKTYGALLLGAAGSFGLSGVVSTQCVVYYKRYPKDSLRTKLMVGASWILDIAHTSFVLVAIYDYFVKNYGNAANVDSIPWSLALSIVVTALQTLLVHCFFAEKILRSSRNNWFITAPILILAVLRLVSATITTANMIRLGRFSSFMVVFPRTMFTTGLTLSAAIDILITGWLCYFLREIRTRIGPHATVMIRMVDTLTLYTLENGALTCFAAIASLVCWLTMPHNLIFMGLHFVISKLYANSLLASLNMRNDLKQIQGRLRINITGQTTDYGKDDGSPESALRIQNSKSIATTNSTHYDYNYNYGQRDGRSNQYTLSDIGNTGRGRNPTTRYISNDVGARIYVAAEGTEGAEGEGREGRPRIRRRIPQEPTTIIQFRPASSYYWNVVAHRVQGGGLASGGQRSGGLGGRGRGGGGGGGSGVLLEEGQARGHGQAEGEEDAEVQSQSQRGREGKDKDVEEGMGREREGVEEGEGGEEVEGNLKRPPTRHGPPPPLSSSTWRTSYPPRPSHSVSSLSHPPSRPSTSALTSPSAPPLTLPSTSPQARLDLKATSIPPATARPPLSSQAVKRNSRSISRSPLLEDPS
ncbi:hypothetical protein CC2G_000069 [Coprinopsis cinerea AmutBmut pab1-1]|nr:hypothetical protein CC2G_000069 [Coprinopsis cinerea AmutBmut pab1-1]